MVGPYKLLQKIGEVGFGVVYMAEQKEPVRRKVALKIIKPGMDTREVIARFETERQALPLPPLCRQKLCETRSSFNGQAAETAMATELARFNLVAEVGS